MSAKKLLGGAFIASAIVNVVLICLLGYFQSQERVNAARAISDRKKPLPSPTSPAMTVGIERVAPSSKPSPRAVSTPKSMADGSTPRPGTPPRVAARSSRRGTTLSPAPKVSPNTFAFKPTPIPSPVKRTGTESPATRLAGSQSDGEKNTGASRNPASEKKGTEGRQGPDRVANAAGLKDGDARGQALGVDIPWQGRPVTGDQAAAVRNQRSQVASNGTAPTSISSQTKPGVGSPNAGSGVKAGTYRFAPSPEAPGAGKEGSGGNDAGGANRGGIRDGISPGRTGTGAGDAEVPKSGSNGDAAIGSGANPVGGGNPGGVTGQRGGASGSAPGQGRGGSNNSSPMGSPNGGSPSGGSPANPGAGTTPRSNRVGDGQSGQNNGGGIGVPSASQRNGSGNGADDAGYRYNAPALPSASRPEPNARAGALVQPRPRTTPTPRPVITPARTPIPTPTMAPSPSPTPQPSPTPRPSVRPTPTPEPVATTKPPKVKTEPKTDEEPEPKQIAGSYSKRGTVVVDAAMVAPPKPKKKKPIVKKPVRRRVVVAKLPRSSPSPSPSPTPSPKPSVSPTPTPTPSPTPTPEPTPKPTATPPPDLQGDGTGLKADYYLGANFEKLLFSRADPKIEFEWGSGAPDARVPERNAWSVRWTGRVRPRYSDEYTFFTAADDGTRVWVNGQQLINDWTIHGVSEVSGKIRLEGGKLYDIRVEFFEKNGESNCSCKVYWESARQKRDFIPQSSFYFPQ